MNAPIRLETLIESIVPDTQLHARWLNTFSFLEYVGFRKIVKSQRAEVLNAAVLAHAVEEGRHALRLKKLAIQIGGAAFDSYAADTLLCGEEAENYLQSLDHQCEAQFLDFDESLRPQLTYVYVTWLIERRALEVYGLYKRVLGATPVAQAIDGLLAEEEGHLRYVEAEIAGNDPQHQSRAAIVSGIEARLYQDFLRALAAALARGA